MVTRLSAFLISLVSATPAWKLDDTVHGIDIELREVPGSDFDEIRLTTTSPQPLDRLCDAVWAKDVGNKAEGDFKKRVIIRETANERWTYEQIHVPVVSDRDYVMYVQLVAPASSGRCVVRFETRTDPAYPPFEDIVRIPSVRGRWELSPTDGGRVRIQYEVYSDPGGSVPAMFARGSQRDAAVSFLKVILARALVP